MNLRINDRAGMLARPGGRHRGRRWWSVLSFVAAAAAIALGPGISPASASNPDARPAIGDVSVFATVPAPGHPFGVAVDRSRVYISTSAGDFFAGPNGGHLNSDGERVFAYDRRGNLVGTTSIATGVNSDMGLFGLALATRSRTITCMSPT